MPLRKVVNQATYLIDCELDLIQMDLEHPERFIEFPSDNSPLARWNGNMMELLEYFMPPQMAGKLSKPSGELMTFAGLVKLVELIFGVIMSKPYDMKTKILTRKKNITPFIDKMRQIIREGVKKLNQ